MIDRMEQHSSSPGSLGDDDADDKQQQQEPQQQLLSQQPQQQQQDAYTDLDLAVDVAQLNARLRSGDFKRWWQDLRPPLVFSLGQKQYGPAGQCVVTSINAFLEAEAWQYNAAGLLSGRRQRLSDLLGIRSRQVFLDKAAKGGWVLLARQHDVQLADLTPLTPLFERLERPPGSSSSSSSREWPTQQADAAAVQVLQLAASNVPDGILAARSGSKAVTAAIDTLQAEGMSGFRAPRVRGAAGGQHAKDKQRRRHHVVLVGAGNKRQEQQQQQQQWQQQQEQPQQQQQQLGQQEMGQQAPLLMLLNQQLQQMAPPSQQQQQQQQHLSMLMLLNQQQQQLTQLVQPEIALPAGDGAMQQVLHDHLQLHNKQQQLQQQKQQLVGNKHQAQLELQQQCDSKRLKQHAFEDAQQDGAAAAAAAAAGAGDSAASGDADSDSADTQHVAAPWHDTAAAAAAAAAAHAGSPGSHSYSMMQAGQLATQQQPGSLPAAAAAADAGCGSDELLWRYERAKLDYSATVAASVAGETAPAAAAAAAAGQFLLPWARRQPWEWEWEQRQQLSPRGRAAAAILMSLSDDMVYW